MPEVKPKKRRPERKRRVPRSFWFIGLGVVLLGLVGVAGWGAMNSEAQLTRNLAENRVVDLPIRAVEITGHRALTEDDVITALGISPGRIDSLRFDAAVARERLLALPWVSDARVRVETSGMLTVEISERIPTAVWEDQRGYWLLDKQGDEIVQVTGPDARSDLPLLIGEGANEAVEDARILLFSVPQPLIRKIVALVRRGERRWDAVLASGLTIKLPADEPLEALRRFQNEEIERRVAPRAVTAVDMRRSDEPLVLTLEPGATAVRLQMLRNSRQ